MLLFQRTFIISLLQGEENTDNYRVKFFFGSCLVLINFLFRWHMGPFHPVELFDMILFILTFKNSNFLCEEGIVLQTGAAYPRLHLCQPLCGLGPQEE